MENNHGIIDLTGQTFGLLTVVEKGQRRSGHTYWKCQCACGKTVDVLSKRLRSGDAMISCGCKRTGTPKNLVGKKFGHLTVIDRAPNHVYNNKNEAVAWNCRCDCGKTLVVRATNLLHRGKQYCSITCKYYVWDKRYYANGTSIGHLTIKKLLSQPYSASDPVYLCVCSCGAELELPYSCIKPNVTCGCTGHKKRVRDLDSGQVFESMAAASRELGVSRAAVQACCAGKTHTCVGRRLVAC